MTHLNKWPRLLVVGEKVTMEQANSILIRTSLWDIQTNDKSWERTVDRIAKDASGKPLQSNSASSAFWRTYFDAMDDWRFRMGILDLSYLYNERIASAWLYGPKGWCDWNGNIGSANFNIGKNPSEENVLWELNQIAQAFPFLDMKVQLVADEEGVGPPAFEYNVWRGKAEMCPPSAKKIVEPMNQPLSAALLLINCIGRERGVTPERLEEAMKQVASETG